MLLLNRMSDFYQISGLDKFGDEIKTIGSDITVAINTTKSNANTIVTDIEAMDAKFAHVGDNPVLYMQSVVAVAGSESLDFIKSHLIAAPLAKALIVKHFGESRDEADAALERLGIVNGLDGISFGLSTMFAEGTDDDVIITA